jgi:hypothetical protein
MATPTSAAASARVWARAVLRLLIVACVAIGSGLAVYEAMGLVRQNQLSRAGMAPRVDWWRTFAPTAMWLAGAGVLLLADRLLLRWIVPIATPNACSACGYDLAGVKEAKCPECGAARA